MSTGKFPKYPDYAAEDYGFATWLRGQCDRDDPVGDLARDYADDCRVEKTRFNTAELRRRIHRHDLAARRAFQDALGEYRRSRRVPS